MSKKMDLPGRKEKRGRSSLFWPIYLIQSAPM